MKRPIIRGIIERRILVNYQIDPEALRPLLPPPLRPQLVKGVGIGGICLIRLRDIRPRFLPSAFGFASENAAHRIAVEWPGVNDRGQGVFIPRRDTSARVNMLAGGRIFPGEHHLAYFEVLERGDEYSVSLRSRDGEVALTVRARLADQLPSSTVFDSLAEASEFFEGGSLGYSLSHNPHKLDGLELRTASWRVDPLAIEHVYSSFFENKARFPAGVVRFDSALLMQGIEHEWHAREPLYCGETHSVA